MNENIEEGTIGEVIAPVSAKAISVDQSARQWLTDPRFARDMFYEENPLAIDSGERESVRNARQYNRAVSIAKSKPWTTVKPMSQADYQRAITRGGNSSEMLAQLMYAQNYVNQAWEVIEDQYASGQMDEKTYLRNKKKFDRFNRIVSENHANLSAAKQTVDASRSFRTGMDQLGKAWGTSFTAGMVGVPIMSAGLGLLGKGAVAAYPYISSFFANPITQKIGKDMVIGTTASMGADEIARQVTPYAGVADGLVKELAKTYFDWKYTDHARSIPEDKSKYINENGHFDFRRFNQDYKMQADAASQRDYTNFLNSGAYPAWLFGAEFLNPVNWLNPTAVASKTGLSRQFDKLGNEVINGMIDPGTAQQIRDRIINGGHFEVEGGDPVVIFNWLKNNPKARTVTDLYHGVVYEHTPNGEIGVRNIDGGWYQTNPDKIKILPQIEMDPEGYKLLKTFVHDPENNRKMLLTGNIFNWRSGDTPRPILQPSDLYTRSLIRASDKFKSGVLAKIDKDLETIATGEYNGKELTLPKLTAMRRQFADTPLDIRSEWLPYEDVTLTNIHESPVLHVNFNGDRLAYKYGHPESGEISHTRLKTPIIVINGPETKTFFDGMVKVDTMVDGSPYNTVSYGNWGRNLKGGFWGNPEFVEFTRELAHTIDNPASGELVDVDGNVNLSAYARLKQELAKYLNKSDEEINNLFNAGRSTTEGINSLDNHLLQVARSAQILPLPEGYTRQEGVTAALLHDLGKIISGNNPSHASASIDLIEALNIPGIDNPKIRGAIEYHMRTPELNLFANPGNITVNQKINEIVENAGFKSRPSEVDTNFASYLHLADVARGLSLADTKSLFPHMFSYNYPKAQVLKGDPLNQMERLNHIFQRMGYNGIDTSLPLSAQWRQLQDVMKQMNTFIRGSRIYLNPNDPDPNHVRNLMNAKKLAIEKGLDPNNPQVLWTIAQEQVPLEPTGSGRLHLFGERNGKYVVAKNTWSDAASIDPEKMDGLYFSVSPETGDTYSRASNLFSYSGQSTILRGSMSDYDILDGESPYEYVERLYPYIHNYGAIANYKFPISPMSDFNTFELPSLLLGREITNMSSTAARDLLTRYFPNGQWREVSALFHDHPYMLKNAEYTITQLPESLIEEYRKFGFSPLDAILNNLKISPIQSSTGVSVVDLPNYRNNMIFNTAGTVGYGPEYAGYGQNFQSVIVAPKGQKVFTVLDELDVNGYPKSSSGAFRDAGGNNMRTGLQVNKPFYKTGGKIQSKILNKLLNKNKKEGI